MNKMRKSYTEILNLDRETAVAALNAQGFASPENALENLLSINKSGLKRSLTELEPFVNDSPSPDMALNNLEKLAKRLYGNTASFLSGEMKTLKKLVYICGSSRMLTDFIIKDQAIIDTLFKKGGIDTTKDRTTFGRELAGVFENNIRGDERPVVTSLLRRYKKNEFLRIATRDLLGMSGMDKTSEELSMLASSALDSALSIAKRLLCCRYGMPYSKDNTGDTSMVILGLGKLGGFELNFSSDIDIIYMNAPAQGDIPTTDKSNLPSDLYSFLAKLAETTTKLIGEITDEGFVFRVDLDLRPGGSKGAIVTSVDSALGYYEALGQTWERAAMIKANPVAGNITAGQMFLARLEPFVYRKYLDFAAIDEIKLMKEKIDIGLLKKNRDKKNIKLGRGGIREIEFFIQSLQLLYGGRDRKIRKKNSLDAIAALHAQGYINSSDADNLTKAYIFLRNLEHRLQIIDGVRTHTLPADNATLAMVARMMGLRAKTESSTGTMLLKKMDFVSDTVHEIYEQLFYAAAATHYTGIAPELMSLFAEDISPHETARTLKMLGFAESTEVLSQFSVLCNGPPFTYLSPKARVTLSRIGPVFMKHIASSSHPENALRFTSELIAAIKGRTSLYALLDHHKDVISLLVKLFATSIFLSRRLIDRPEGMEYLFSEELNRPFKNIREIENSCPKPVDVYDNYEELLNSLRRFTHDELMRIGFNDITGRTSVTGVSYQISSLADVTLKWACEAALEIVTKKHGCPGVYRFGIFALGKLGGQELLYSSDLDIIFIYSAENNNVAITNGTRAISSQEFFSKVAQKIISILTLHTEEGIVFKVDTRLRPSGNAGLLVTSKEAFILYQRQNAQAWERQAMIKMRFVCGNIDFGKEIQNKTSDIVFDRALSTVELSELIEIRERMETEIAQESSGLIDIKVGYGGLVDIEFLIQILQLRHGRFHTCLRTPNTKKALNALVNKGLLEPGDYAILNSAYDMYVILQNKLRIMHNRPDNKIYKDPSVLSRLATSSGYDSGDKMLQDLIQKKRLVRNIYDCYLEMERD